MTEIVVDPSVTNGPIGGSTKIYVDGVPFRRVNLSNGEHLDLYDTSGPYTDPHALIDLHKGLPSRPSVYAIGARSYSGHGPARSPRRWRSSPCGRVCRPSWCATRWLSGVR